MTVTRFKLPFGKMPPKFNDAGVEQWQDYCAVTDVNSDKPDEVVLIDLNLSSENKTDILKEVNVSEATIKDMEDFEVGAKRGLPNYKTIALKDL